MITLTPWVKRLLIANVAVYVMAMATPLLHFYGALIPAAVGTRPWTPITYMFLHAGLTHILFNMLGLFFFGPRLEERLGGQDFLKLYLWGGVGERCSRSCSRPSTRWWAPQPRCTACCWDSRCSGRGS